MTPVNQWTEENRRLRQPGSSHALESPDRTASKDFVLHKLFGFCLCHHRKRIHTLYVWLNNIYIYIYSGYLYRFCVCFLFQICPSETNNVILLPASGVMASDGMAWRYLDQSLEISQSNFSNHFAPIFLPIFKHHMGLWGAWVWLWTFLKSETIQAANRCQKVRATCWMKYFIFYPSVFWVYFFLGKSFTTTIWNGGGVTWRRIIIVRIKSHVELKKWLNKTSEMLLGITSQPDS